METEIKFIHLDAVYDLRNRVLRPNQPISACYYSEDKQDSAFHLAAYLEQKIIAISSFYYQTHSELADGRNIRLRGMAVEPNMQGAGVGTNLLAQAIEICKKANADLLWCNARVTAKSFYSNLGFQVQGKSFEIPNIGEHYLMFRPLK